ncbi:hypothetical protein IJ843_06885 [bacterium]|nr:hypothetical protein [bacterium]
MMISPVSRVSFRGTDMGVDRTMDAIEKTQKAMATVTNLKEGADEFTKNMKTDTEAYSDAVTSNLSKVAEENKALKPIADAANSKVGKKIADIFGGFTAFCTNLAGAATTVTTITK